MRERLPLTRASRDLSPKGEVGSIAALAARLRRPADAWPGLGRLAPEEIERLARAIDRASARQTEELEAALRRAMTPPLAALLLARLRRRRS